MTIAKLELPTLEQWAQHILDPKPSKSTVEISRFGLQNSSDVIHFLQSPEGLRIKEAIAKQLAEEKAYQEMKLMQAQEQAEQNTRLKGLLLLALVSTEESIAAKMREVLAMQQQTSKQSDTYSSSSAQTNQERNHAIGEYLAQIQQNEMDLLANEQESKTLTDKLRAAQKVIDDKYQNYEDALLVIDKIAEMKPNTEVLATKYKDVSAEIETLNTQLLEAMNKELMDDVRTILNQLNSLAVQRAGIIALSNPDKWVYLDKDKNELVSTDDYKKAEYILPADKKLVIENGQLYLLPAGETLNDTNRIEAKRDFELNKNAMLPVKTVVASNKALESEEEPIKGITDKLTANAEQKMLLQTLKQTLANELDKTLTDLKPTSPRPSMNMEKLSNPYLSAVTKVQLKASAGRNISIQEFNNLRDLAPTKQRHHFVNFLNNLKITEPTPIPSIKMQGFLKNMTALGLNPYRPGISNIPSPAQSRSPQAGAQHPADSDQENSEEFRNWPPKPSPFKL